MVSARLSGDASIDYTSYSVRDNKKNHLSAHSLTQDYSLLYSSEGKLYNSRVGKYSVSLGYNWSALDTHIASPGGKEDVKASRGHLYYGGEVVVDPKELPLHFSAYSRDLNRNSFSSTTSSESAKAFGIFSNSGGLLGGPNLPNGINDGVHIDSGATLVAGVKNGMTNGYNEILRHFPMIMLDYRDQVDRDLRSQTPIDTRLTRLAFVSLNKKDNWFHYRYVTYNDNLNSSNDYLETQVQIGSIDQTLARRWIDFTNWIQVSTDLQLTKHNNSYMNQNYEQIDLNLFAQARRSNWEAYNYNSFNRYREDSGSLTQSVTLPLYLSGTLSHDLSWSTRTAFRNIQNNSSAHMESLVAGYRIDAYKNSPFTLSQFFDVESAKSEKSELLALAGGIETASTLRWSRRYGLAASYNIRNSSNVTSSDRSDFIEHRLSLRANYTPSNSVRISLNQENDFTNGSNVAFASLAKDSSTALPQYTAPRSGAVSSSGSGGSSYHSMTSLMMNWNPLARLNYNASATEDVYKDDLNGLSKITMLSTSVDYTTAKFVISDSLSYSKGSYQLGQNSSSFSNSTVLGYTHNRNLNSRVSLAYNRWSDSSATTYSVDAEQKLTYTYYSYSGLTRKLFEVDEMITYSNSPYLSQTYFSSTYNSITSPNNTSSSYGATNQKKVERGTLSLGFKYYPLRQVVLSSGARYQFDDSPSNYSLLWYSSVSANYRLLQTSLDYFQGKRQSDGILEKKITANVRKSF